MLNQVSAIKKITEKKPDEHDIEKEIGSLENVNEFTQNIRLKALGVLEQALENITVDTLTDGDDRSKQALNIT